MTFSNRRTYNERLTIGYSKKAYHWWGSNIGRAMIGCFWIRSKKGYHWLDSNTRRATIGCFWIRGKKGYDWWDSNIRRATIGRIQISEGLRLVNLNCCYEFKFWRENLNFGGKLIRSFPVHDFRWPHFRWCHFRLCNFRWRYTTNTAWAVPIYYCSSPGRVKPKTIKLVFVTSPLSKKKKE